MQFIDDETAIRPLPGLANGCVTVAGVLDGCHLGHQKLLSVAQNLARETGLPVVALTFDPHPSVVLAKRDVALLSDVEKREALLRQFGADEVVVLRFTPTRAAQQPNDFVQDVLVSQLNAKHVVVGENFTYGHKAQGDTNSLASSKAFQTHATELVNDVAGPVTSTRIREELSRADMGEVARMLGRGFEVCGEVVHGEHRGRELGYPTANVSISPHLALPADGVYAGWVQVDKRYPAAISLGENSTFGSTKRTLEAYLIDVADIDLYAKTACVEFVSLLRPMVTFDSVATLVEQMGKDVSEARAALALR